MVQRANFEESLHSPPLKEITSVKSIIYVL